MANRLEFEATMSTAGFRAGIVELEQMSQAAAVRINTALSRAGLAAGLQNKAKTDAAELAKYNQGLRGASEAAMDIGVIGSASTVFHATEAKTDAQKYGEWWKDALGKREAAEIALKEEQLRGIRQVAVAGVASNIFGGHGFGAGGGPGGGISGIMRESLVILREIGRANFSRVPGSVTLLAQYTGVLGTLITSTAAGAIKAAAAENVLARSMAATALAAEAKASAARRAAEAEGFDSIAANKLVDSNEAEAASAMEASVAQNKKAKSAIEAAEIENAAAKVSISVWGYLVAALVVVAIAAYLVWRHLRTINQELDRTGKAAQKGFGDMTKSITDTMYEAAKEAADYNDWLRRLGYSYEDLAKKTQSEIDLMDEQFQLMREVARLKPGGDSQSKERSADQEERQKKLDLIEKNLKAQRDIVEQDKSAVAAAQEKAFSGRDAIQRQERLNNAPSTQKDIEDAVSKYKDFKDELQAKVDKQLASDLSDLRMQLNYQGTTPEEQKAMVDLATKHLRSKNYAVGPKGQEQMMTLDQASGTLDKLNKWQILNRRIQEHLEMVQKERVAALNDEKDKTKKDSAAVEQLTDQRDKLKKEIELHNKFNPLIDSAEKSKQLESSMRGHSRGHSRGSDSLVRVGNFLGTARGKVEQMAEESNRIAREQLGVSKRIEENTRARRDSAHYSVT